MAVSLQDYPAAEVSFFAIPGSEHPDGISKRISPQGNNSREEFSRGHPILGVERQQIRLILLIQVREILFPSKDILPTFDGISFLNQLGFLILQIY